jgi:hypothetical protein
MRLRRIDFAKLILSASVLAAPALAPIPSFAQAPQNSVKDQNANAALPVTDVVLFSSGVGYFQRDSKVDGDAQVELKFDAKDINDLLKSMVVQDFGNGTISAVSYTSRDPITKALKTFAIDLTSNPTLGDLLNQIRGEKVSVMAPGKVEGTIVGVEKKTIAVDGKTLLVEKLNLLTEEGLRSIDLAQAQQIRLLRPELEAELRKALVLLALGHDTEKKTVRLNFTGKGNRKVKVGYIVESPIWKTSYRLVVQPDGALFLQGWAIVENTGEEDWNNVNLTLVSGRPISFLMDLYQPLYVNRPVVEPELYASLRPQTYGQDMEEANQEFKRLAQQKGAPTAPGFAGPVAERARANRDYDGKQFALAGAAAANKAAKDESWNLAQGGQAMASATDVGELFRYSIEGPVKIARRQSAMIPIVNETIKGEKVSIYNESVQAKHPLNGLKITNSTPLHLMQGPITVFDGGVYAGDAKIEDLTPGTERLISYALDLDTEVSPQSKGHPDQMLAIKFHKGTLYIDHKAQQTKSFTVKNSGSKPKKVLLEHTKSGDWKLVSPAKPDDTTRDRYRFAVSAEPGKPAKLDIVEERLFQQTVGVNNLDDNSIRYYASLAITSQKIKDALANVIKLKNELSVISRERQVLQNEIAEIDREQGRIRQNMPQLDKTSELYGRYVAKLNDQETRIEALRVQIEGKLKQEQAKQKALDEFLYSLDLT